MAQQKFKIEINAYLIQILQQSERQDQDIINFVQLLGHKKVFEVIQDSQLKQMLKQVIKQDTTIEQIVEWISNYKITLQEEKKKKNKVPQIYTTTTDSAKKNQLSQQKKKPNQIQNSKTENVNDSGAKKVQHEQKPKIFDRFQQREPPIKKKVKKQVQRVDKNQSQKVEDVKEGQKIPVITQGKVKCKYFPFCKNEQCQFFHPTQKCSFFPKCKFGAACLNVHQICKFKQNCTRANCFYDHPFKSKLVYNLEQSNNPLMQMMKLVLGQQQQKKPPMRRKRITSSEIGNKQAIVENKQ